MKCRHHGTCTNEATHYFSVSAHKVPKDGAVSDQFKKWGYTAFCDKCSAHAANNTFWQYNEISIEAYARGRKRFNKTETTSE